MSLTSLLLRPTAEPREADLHPRTAIIDIGSNSIRLVVYQGPPRLPAVLFNEKVMAGLGRSLAATGAIDAAALALATEALARFAAVARAMAVTTLRTVATAAVRDASNGAALIAAAQAQGLTVELLSGDAEAAAAGEGVLSAFPDADGIVGDLGGGSLELVRIRNGAVAERASFPLGVLRLPALRAKGTKVFVQDVAKRLAKSGWSGRGKALPFYMVGGSWRALARLDMELSGYPLPIIHGYRLSPPTLARLARQAPRLGKARLRAISGLAASRAATLADASALLAVVLRELGCGEAIASASGLREGLLHAALGADERAQDPLIVAAREEGRLSGRFPGHGDLLHAWIAPLFADEPPAVARLRHAACLLADVGWRANPDFRAERGVEVALHGQWVGIDAAGRAQVAQALHANFGGGALPDERWRTLAMPDQLARATAWGLATRLGMRLSGGAPEPLARCALALGGESVVLRLEPADRALYGEAIARRHAALATQLGRSAVVG